MTQPRVLVARRIPSVALSRLEESCDVDVHTGAQELTQDELIARLQGAQGLVSILTTPVNRAVLAACPDLKVVANVAVGYNNIDVAAAREHGVIVTNTPDVLTEASADLTWALILGITRRVVEGDRLIRAGGWKGWALDFMLGSDLRGKQLGVIGFGRIGQAVAARASAFGMRVAYQSRKAMGPPDYQPMPYDRLLATSDVVTLHCPLTEETRHLIDQKSLARMKREASVKNSSSMVSIRLRVSGPVSSTRWVPSAFAQEWITPRGPKRSRNWGKSAGFG
jgi:glyoxylate reductase